MLELKLGVFDYLQQGHGSDCLPGDTSVQLYYSIIAAPTNFSLRRVLVTHFIPTAVLKYYCSTFSRTSWPTLRLVFTLFVLLPVPLLVFIQYN